MKRTVIAALALSLALSGCSASPQASTSATPTPTADAAQVTVPDVIGQAGDAARDALMGAGFLVEFDAGEDSVWKASNWTVDNQSPAAGAEAKGGDTVVLTVTKPEAAPAPAPVVEATSTGLTATFAQVACDTYAESQFPFGWDGHWYLGKLAERIENDQWFFKITADVTNEYNAEREVNVECRVAGTNDAPVVADFLAY